MTDRSWARFGAWIAGLWLVVWFGLWVGVTAVAAPLAPAAVPEPLKPWVPWVLYGSEQLACPSSYQQAETRGCVWPSLLELQTDARGVSFRFEVQVYGVPAIVELPGSTEAWPQDLRDGNVPLAVVLREQRPTVQLSAGRHPLTGRIGWAEMPQDLLLPKAVGSLRVTLDGAAVHRIPDAEGRLWLRQPVSSAPAGDAVSLRVARQVDDQIPLRVVTHYELSVAGRPRELRLAAALLPGFVAEAIATGLPARLNDDGSLSLQLRAGEWAIDLTGRAMTPLKALTLPASEGAPEETWSFVAHNELRLLNIEGVPQIDPKQVALPEAWRAFPAYRLKPGDTMKLTETRRGNPDPGPDKLTIAREIWLDFDGGGYTMRDAIGGQLSRSWRLDVAGPALLGRAAIDGTDQPITRIGAETDPAGIEVRHGRAAISADSRIEAPTRHLSATGWRTDFESAQASLNLPPGWRLLHAGGVDTAGGSWVNGWSLWDFFFVLVGALAAARLLGWRTGALLGVALVVSWHLAGAPGLLWLALLAFVALMRVLPEGRLRRLSIWGRGLVAGLIVLWLLPFAVQQIRFSLYPSLELAQSSFDEPRRRGGIDAPVIAGAPPPMAPAPEAVMRSRLSYSGKAADAAKAAPQQQQQRLDEIDPRAQVQTGPGVPTWHWNVHRLAWQGPVQASQVVDLWLLPPAGTVVWRLGSLLLLAAALLAVLGQGRWWTRAAKPMSKAAPAVAMLALVLGLSMASTDASALAPQPPQPPTAGVPPTAIPAPTPPDSAPRRDLLEELKERLTAAPDCMPACAEIARLRVEAQGSRVQLRLEAHALADVMLPLPGQGTNWRANAVTLDGKPATLRRDEAGTLWIALRAGVAQVVLDGDVGSAASVEIALPMPVRELSSQLSGWSLAGLDARGLPAGALSLAREAGSGASTKGDGSTQRDALPPFLSVQRSVRLGLRWTVETRIQRVGASRAPAQVRIRLLDGESVTDAAVRVVDGHALVQLGGEDEASFTSSLKEQPKLRLQSTTEPNQIERWQLDASTQWHAVTSGIAPVLHQEGERWMPVWQPWPGEAVAIDITRPAGVAGQTITVDKLATTITPGLRATEVLAVIGLRSSQGGNHRIELPEGAQPNSLLVDGQPQPVPTLQPGTRHVVVPITPGAHQVQLGWREPRGIEAMFRSSRLNVGAPGVNESVHIQVPQGRVVLALGGPPVGPAVLFWGVVVALAGVAWGLGRLRLTPLGVVAWFLLGLGLAQASLIGAAIVGGWFFALALRGRHAALGSPALGRRWFNAWQVLLVLWTLVAAAVLLETLHTGLLGHPDLMIAGNGSSAWRLNWYQDRFAGLSSSAWVFSVPVLIYRLAMLAWALWLAVALLKWVRWAWECFSRDGVWRARPPAPEPVVG